ncbi:MAG: cobalt transporter [Alteromonadaceae bacterium]|nr:MAG: cobalt transporter [Alteromonadaceae bacterium]
MSLQITTNHQLHVQSSTRVLLQNLSVLAFGAVIVFAVGFLPLAEAHNSAHDTRHAMAFPCH